MRTIVIFFGLGFFLLTGCGQDKGNLIELENGFVIEVHSKGFIHKVGWAELKHRDSNGKLAVVWPYVHNTGSIQINNDTAIWLGGKAVLCEDGRERLMPRLIALKSSSRPALDITDQVLDNWCLENGVDFTNVLQGSLVGLAKTNVLLQLDFTALKRGSNGSNSIDILAGAALLSWPEVEGFIQDAKAHGKLKKEKWSGVEYIEKGK